MVRQEYRDGFEFVPMLYPFYKKDAIVINSSHLLEEYQKYINQHHIEQAEIVHSDLSIVKHCPSLKHLKIFPDATAEPTSIDYSVLYETSEILSLNCFNKCGDKHQYTISIDYSRIKGLVNLFVGVNQGTLNFNKVDSLRSLNIGGFKGKSGDLTDLFCSRELDTLRMIECGIKTLDGIERSSKMQCLYLHYNRSLHDISSLRKVKSTLRALRIENCPKITDFSVLSELENLELLELSGSNTLPNLLFLKTMKNLKTFIFSMNVQDGDLYPCLPLSYVYSAKNRKHYNLKDIELPKGTYIHGNESIELWRRFE